MSVIVIENGIATATACGCCANANASGIVTANEIARKSTCRCRKKGSCCSCCACCERQQQHQQLVVALQKQQL
jgi:hypothetical protein